MRLRDLYSNLSGALALAPAVYSASADGSTVDLIGARGVVFSIATGAIVGAGAFSVKVQESADGVTWADAPAARVQSNAPAALAASSSYRVGYVGKLRYARLQLIKASGTSIAAAASAVINPLDKPAT